MGRIARRLATYFEVGGSSVSTDGSLLEARFLALQKQVPLLYLVALANFVGLHLATGGRMELLSLLPITLITLVTVRLAHWYAKRNQRLPPEAIRTELRKTLAFTILFSIGFSIWTAQLLKHGDPLQQTYVMLFGSLAAIGCAYGLSSFPAAARLPLLLLAMPLAAQLMLSSQTGHVGAGVSLALITLLIMRLLAVHNAGFARLVESRAMIAAERERAQAAEKIARAEQDKARRSADTDHLTGLANRRRLLAALDEATARPRAAGDGAALVIIDLDGFKPINDTFGHATGDAVLREIASRLAGGVVSNALVARMGGDEFALLVEGVAEVGQAKALGRRICRLLQRPCRIDDRLFQLSACCGITLLGGGEVDPAQALIRADTALYRAKNEGRASAALFSLDMEEMNRRRRSIERALRRSTAHEHIRLVFQPICGLSTGVIQSFEALSRWDHPSLGPLSPAEFIPIAEQIGVISEISDSLLGRAAAEASRWPGSVKLSFNLSAVQLCTVGSGERILHIIERQGLRPDRLQVEVTETALLVDFHVARANLLTLKQAGARIVLDDFGAGHASISYLREMQFDGIKLDGSLLAEARDDVRARRLLRGVLDLCASLGVPCVAEHVETAEQAAMLADLGCQAAQGFWFGAPMTAAEAEAIVHTGLSAVPEPSRGAGSSERKKRAAA